MAGTRNGAAPWSRTHATTRPTTTARSWRPRDPTAMATSSPVATLTPLRARASSVTAATSATTGSSVRTRTRWNGTSARCVAVAVLVGEGIELILERRLQRLVGGGDAVGQLVGPARPHDGRRDGGVGQHPGDGHGGQRQAGLVGHAPKR